MIHCTYGGVLGTVHILCHPFDRRVWVDTWLNTKPEVNIVTWALTPVPPPVHYHILIMSEKSIASNFDIGIVMCLRCTTKELYNRCAMI